MFLDYYQKYVVTPFLTDEIPSHYSKNFHCISCYRTQPYQKKKKKVCYFLQIIIYSVCYVVVVTKYNKNNTELFKN